MGSGIPALSLVVGRGLTFRHTKGTSCNGPTTAVVQVLYSTTVLVTPSRSRDSTQYSLRLSSQYYPKFDDFQLLVSRQTACDHVLRFVVYKYLNCEFADNRRLKTKQLQP